MKKIVFPLFVLALLGCQKDPGAPEIATYCVATYDATDYTLTVGRQSEVSIFVKSAAGLTTSSDVVFGIKADENMVASYNSAHGTSASMLPSSAYSFALDRLTVFKNKDRSLSTAVTISISCDLKDGLYVLPVNISSVEGSAAAAQDACLYIVVKKAASEKGSGTKDDPFLIHTAQDLLDMHQLCRSEAEAKSLLGGDGTVYFKMAADVDLKMSEGCTSDWEPINTASPYDKRVDFNGNGKTIRNLVSQYYNYSSFYGVVYGNIYDVTFENSVIVGESAIGTIGGYGGTNSSGGRIACLNNVHVKNGKVIQNESENKGVGGLIGRMYGSKIEACSFDGHIESSYNMIGGIIGQDTHLPCEIINCSSSGSLTILHGQRAGGIAGCLTIAGSSVKNCFSSMGVDGRLAAGGIVGHANLDSSSPKTPYNVIQKCIAWNDHISAVSGDITSYSSGAVVGFGAATNTCEDCYYRSGLKVSYKSAELDEYFKIVDQPNCSKDSPQTVGVEYKPNESSSADKRYKLPYHGKASTEGQTASQIAALLGWDTGVWNLSGSIPVLK